MKRLALKGKQNANLYRYEGNSTVYVIISKVGKGQIERSTGKTSLAEARIERDRIKAEWLSNKPIVNTNVRELWTKFLFSKKTKAPNTYKNIESRGRLHLLKFFGDFKVEDVNEPEWERYIAYRYQRPRQAEGENSKLPKLFNDAKYFQMFLTWCFQQSLIPRLPKLRDPDPELKVGKVYTQDEIVKLYRHADDDLALKIDMGLKMFMRIGEITQLAWDRVDLVAGYIHLRAEDTKIRKARSFAINGTVLKKLKTLPRVSKYVFPNKLDHQRPMDRQGHRTAWVTCKRRAGVVGRFHDLRHTALTEAFKHSKDWTAICMFAGLSLEEAQKTYLHITHEHTRHIAQLWDNHGSFDALKEFSLDNRELENDRNAPQASALPG